MIEKRPFQRFLDVLPESVSAVVIAFMIVVAGTSVGSKTTLTTSLNEISKLLKTADLLAQTPHRTR